ncbi:MAG TPA: hypothetical protein VIN06_02340 [Devosia sp.]
MQTYLLAAALAVAGVTSANAATISIVSMQYSAAQPVPHIHYEGETYAGDVDTLRGIYESFVHCRIECSGPDGASTAVLTMNGPGGNYGEGLALADFLRENHIATVVERGMSCYSACAFAFLGGSGYASMQGLGTYIDRQIEPGGIVGFHAPYRDEASFLQALEERGATEIMSESRDSLALMVQELVKWNVDPEILSYMVGKGPNDLYNVLAADDYYLIRAALPPTPAEGWITDLPSAVKNACLRLLAIDTRSDPLTLQNWIDVPWQDDIGTTEFGGTVAGYHWNDNLLDIGGCGITSASAATDGDYEISLFWNPGLDGHLEAGTTFFNRIDGWSSAGPGRNPVKRILQKGPMNHYFLPVGVPIDDLDLPGEVDVLANRFFTALPPLLPSMDPELVTVASTASSRISQIGNVFVFEQTGPKQLFDSAVAAPGAGVTFSNDAVTEVGFVREGAYADGTPFSWFGFANGDAAAVVRIIVVRTDGLPATAEEMATVRRIQCAAEFQGLKLGC